MSLVRRRFSLPTGLPNLLLVLIGLCCAPAAQAADDAWVLLKKPGHIVLLRHSNAPGIVPESNDMNFKDCSIQRNLDAEGRAQAAPDRRCLPQARHPAGAAPLQPILPRHRHRQADQARPGEAGAGAQPGRALRAGGDARGRRRRACKLLKSIPARPLTVLVSHVTNIQAIADVKLSSGEMAVVHFDKAGKLVVDGRITVP